jgi:hypothetical protein
MFWKAPRSEKTPRCSFCQKWETAAEEFIASPAYDDVFICSDCVTACNSILTDRRAALEDAQGDTLGGMRSGGAA